MPPGRHRTGTDVKNVGLLNLSPPSIVFARSGALFPAQAVEPGPEPKYLISGNQHQIRKHAAAKHDRSDARPNDVTNTEQSRVVFNRN